MTNENTSDVETSKRRRIIVPTDPTPRLKDLQGSIVIWTLARLDADLLDTPDGAVLQQLVTVGGAQAPKELAEETGYHLSSLYRALQRRKDLVEHN